MSKVKVDQERVKEVFEHYPKAQSVIVTSDGTIFIDKSKSYAKYHATQNKLEWVEIPRDSQDDATQKSKSSIEDWRKNQASIMEKAEEIGFELPKTAKSNALKIEAIEAFIADLKSKESEEKKVEGDGSETKSDEANATGSSDITDHKIQE